MNKTKTITMILLLMVALVFAGCSGPVARQSNDLSPHLNDDMSQHDCDEEVAQVFWSETGSIDIDWPY
jgi:hypothetical protein